MDLRPNETNQRGVTVRVRRACRCDGSLPRLVAVNGSLPRLLTAGFPVLFSFCSIAVAGYELNVGQEADFSS